MKCYSVIFKENGRLYNFLGNDDLNEKEYVIVETEKGLQYGQIIKTIDEFKDDSLKNIVRIATDEDTSQFHKNLKDNQIALKKCRKLVDDMKLNMNVISAEFSFDKKQLLFNFTSDERIDFRELAKKLASIYHTRIELRQIGARDKAKEVGGIGICGQKLCCGRFLSHIDAISMNMAKNQNLALNPTKINGLCGRLLCCLQYEDDNYIECSKGLPSVGETIKTKDGEGKVTNVDILNRKCKVLIGSNKQEIVFEEKNGKSAK